MNFQAVSRAWARALRSQFHFRMLVLSLLPFFLTLLLWGVAMWWGMQGLIDLIQGFFLEHDAFKTVGDTLNGLGLAVLKTVIVPLIAMWALLPLMVISSLLIIGLFAMPAINRHVGTRDYPHLETRNGGSFFGSLLHSGTSFGLFLFFWIMSLPLLIFPPVHVVMQPFLWGWLTYRVMTYDALAEHANEQERQQIVSQHRKALLVIGIVTGFLGAVPTFLWLGGALSIFFFPLFAGLAIWLYVLVFIFTGLWFQHYCLAALMGLRAQQESTETQIATSMSLEQSVPPQLQSGTGLLQQ
jgi:hypothetical protein